MVGIPQLLGFLGEAGSRIFKWRDKKKKRAINELKKEVVSGSDNKRLSDKFRRVFGRKK